MKSTKGQGTIKCDGRTAYVGGLYGGTLHFCPVKEHPLMALHDFSLWVNGVGFSLSTAAVGCETVSGCQRKESSTRLHFAVTVIALYKRTYVSVSVSTWYVVCCFVNSAVVLVSLGTLLLGVTQSLTARHGPPRPWPGRRPGAGPRRRRAGSAAYAGGVQGSVTVRAHK